ncbi:hypothetical protein DSM03_101807 [Leeuwenhoekiella aestuarii]|uniref:Uncharacterized protein n=1 Tax=Leeuwenhoekiella aestuarii TaxID=2249426 RepID=A0A4Q0P056_9FLAO|nr:hypothetical protein [Leeuwenhoekiella aestuarii]RXG18128.1 hypothetical protein DSM04_101316 [Leeuwenhoekiella aestuarii]RXG19433.1 hypothetical protein DSM03_101807 [Leeuwenhoekiella aestuarii]
MDLDVLYTPLHFNSTKRLKSFIASATINDTLVSQIVTLAYVGTPTLEYFSGLLFTHNYEGILQSVSFYEEGVLIKRIIRKGNGDNKQGKAGNCINPAEGLAFILEYGIDEYEAYFVYSTCLEETTITAPSSGGDFSGSGGGDIPSGGHQIPVGNSYVGNTSGSGGGGASSPGNSSSPGSPSSITPGEPFWQENVSPSTILISSLSSQLNLNVAQTNWLNALSGTSLLPFQISYFLQLNNNSIEAKNFAKEAIGVLTRLDLLEKKFDEQGINPLNTPWLNELREIVKHSEERLSDDAPEFIRNTINESIDLTLQTMLTATAINLYQNVGDVGNDSEGHKQEVFLMMDKVLLLYYFLSLQTV